MQMKQEKVSGIRGFSDSQERILLRHGAATIIPIAIASVPHAKGSIPTVSHLIDHIITEVAALKLLWIEPEPRPTLHLLADLGTALPEDLPLSVIANNRPGIDPIHVKQNGSYGTMSWDYQYVWKPMLTSFFFKHSPQLEPVGPSPTVPEDETSSVERSLPDSIRRRH